MGVVVLLFGWIRRFDLPPSRFAPAPAPVARGVGSNRGAAEHRLGRASAGLPELSQRGTPRGGEMSQLCRTVRWKVPFKPLEGILPTTSQHVSIYVKMRSWTSKMVSGALGPMRV